MGFWSIWHFVAFIGIAAIAAGLARRGRVDPDVSGYGGWLVVFSAFLLFWAAQELAEFYRVKAQIEVLVPSALDSPDYHAYIGYAMALAWFEAILLTAGAGALIKGRAPAVVKAAIAILWLAGPVCAAAEFLLAHSYFGEYLVEDDYSALAATTLFATIWTWYLLTSIRVGNTYTASSGTVP